MLEVSVGLAYKLVKSERVVVASDKILEIDQLMLVYDADQHVSLRARVRSYCIHPCCAVAELGGDVSRDLVGMCGDDCEFVCGLGSLDYIIAHKV